MSRIMPLHGIIGFFIILITQLLVLLRSSFFFDYYFPVIWLGYILLVDGLVRLIKGRSIYQNKSEFIKLFLISATFWLIFEFVTVFIYNFEYITTYDFSDTKYFILSALTFSTVLPAIVETTDLANALEIFRGAKKRSSGLKLKKEFLYSVSILGVLLFLVPIFRPEFLFPIFWVMFFLILDPINYINGQPSIIKSVVERDYEILLSLIFAGIFCGFFWEFWNYWSYAKWSFMVPFFDYQRLFKMSWPGYVGLLFFTLELFAMYHFSKYVIKKSFAKSEKKKKPHKFKMKKKIKLPKRKDIEKTVKKVSKTKKTVSKKGKKTSKK